MAHTPRFYVPDCTADAECVNLPRDEMHQALNVLRLRKDDPAIIFNGAGLELVGTVEAIDRREVRVSVSSTVQSEASARRLTVLLASPGRGKTTSAAVQRGTELGVDRFVLFSSAHSEGRSRDTDKLRRSAVESCRQCERVWLPSILIADSMDDALAEAEGALLLGDPRQSDASIAEALQSQEHASVAIGPEGGFSADEVAAMLDAGARRVSFSSHVLRAEVAVGAAAAILRHHLA